jgi:hypothetical protein
MRPIKIGSDVANLVAETEKLSSFHPDPDGFIYWSLGGGCGIVPAKINSETNYGVGIGWALVIF